MACIIEMLNENLSYRKMLIKEMNSYFLYVFFGAMNGFSLKHEQSEFFKEAIIAQNNTSHEVLGMKFHRL